MRRDVSGVRGMRERGVRGSLRPCHTSGFKIPAFVHLRQRKRDLSQKTEIYPVDLDLFTPIPHIFELDMEKFYLWASTPPISLILKNAGCQAQPRYVS